MAGPGGQSLELIDVVLAQLIVEEPISSTDQRLLGEHAGDQQRRRVCRGKVDGVDRKQRMESARPRPETLCRVVQRGSGAPDHQRAARPRGCFHTAILLQMQNAT